MTMSAGPVTGTPPLLPGASTKPAAVNQVPNLPEPAAPSGDSMQDALAMIYAAMSALERSQTSLSESSVKQAKTERNVAQMERQEALERARQEASKGGFFKWVSDDLGLGGVAGLATFNYALVAADLTLHKTGIIHHLQLDLVDGAAVMYRSPEVIAADVLLRKTDLTPESVKEQLDKLGLGTSVPGISDEDVKPVVDRAIQINLLVAGTASSILTAGSTGALVVAIVGAALSVSGTVVQETGGSEKLALGLEIAGAACTLGSCGVSMKDGVENAAKAADKAGDKLAANAAAKAADKTVFGASRATSANIAAGGAGLLTDGTSGIDTIVRTVHQHAADTENIKAQEALDTLQRLEHLLDQLIDGAKETHESHQRATETLQGAMQTHDQTLLMASSMRG